MGEGVGSVNEKNTHACQLVAIAELTQPYFIRVLNWIGKKAIRKYIRSKNEITLDQIKENLSTTYHPLISIPTIHHYLHAYG